MCSRRHTLELSGETIWHISTVFDVVKPRHGDCKISPDSAMAVWKSGNNQLGNQPEPTKKKSAEDEENLF